MKHQKVSRCRWMIPLSMLICCGTGLAQTAGVAGAQPLPNGDYVTKLKIIPEPMSKLLNQGFSLVNMAIGLGGVGYLLHRHGKWVACSIVQSSQAGPNKAVSHCAALN
ncbi:MAG: hypothetical protein POH28_16645 [Acidocella sp.]|nr:hypothetical protein [Acidocella sp.]